MAMTTDEVIAKVKKLLALAANEGATPAEAERAAVQAKALLRKYELDMADVMMKKMESDDPMVEEYLQVNPTAYGKNQLATLPIWIRFILTGVTIYTRTRVFIAKNNNVMFAGMEHDVMMAKHLTQYLVDATYSQATKDSSAASKSDRSAFRYGMSSELQRRLKQLRREEDVAAEQEAKTSTGTSLMVIDQKRDQLLDQKYGALKTKKVKRSFQTSAYDAGRQAGQRQSLNRQLSGGSQQLQIGG